MVFTGLLIVAAIVVCIGVTAYWQRRMPVLQDGSKLIAAVQAFSRDERARGEAMPTSVALSELIRKGYITRDEVRAFDGMDVTFSLTADETRPQSVLVRARLPDGSTVIVLGDGSAQQVSPKAASR